MDGTVLQQNLCVEAPTLNVNVFGDESLGKYLRPDEIMIRSVDL